jgi:hypothetical protein
MSPLTKEIVHIRAILISEGVRYPVLIESYCEDGIYCITLPEKKFKDISPGTWIKLQFQLPSEKTVSLDCRVKWSYKTPPHFLTTSIGLNVLSSFTLCGAFFTS